MKQILLTPRAFHNYGTATVKMLEEKGYQVKINDTGQQLSSEMFAKYAKESTGIVIGVDELRQDLIAKCPHLKAVVKFGVGTDNIDVAFAEQLGISVGRTLGTNSTAVAELVVGLMFSCAREIPGTINNVKDGGWTKPTGIELKRKTIGIVGFGSIGQEVARLAKGIGMKVLAYDAFPISDAIYECYKATPSTMENLFKMSDFITLHVPLVEETRDLISEREFKQMKKTAFLINASRGGVVNEKDLLKAPKNQEIAFAAADVFSTEPPSSDQINRELLELENFYLTSHIGSRTMESEMNTINKSVENLLELLDR